MSLFVLDTDVLTLYYRGCPFLSIGSHVFFSRFCLPKSPPSNNIEFDALPM